ncbi:MAG: hypothetical protein KTR20_13100 [Cellvibrionaceae bacterium]|nr:hypothetical protein [Cellvibrionaceae bacterium]
MKPSEQTLKVSIKSLYQDIRLSDEELADLRKQTAHTHNRKTYFTPFISTAVCLAVCLAVFYTFWQDSIQKRIVDNLMADVISNHLSHKELVYQTASVAELSRHFSYLGFLLSHSNYVDASIAGDLLGARPCLILNVSAAQLRYQLDEHHWATVFQVRYDKNIYGDIPDKHADKQALTRTQQGISVNIWREGDILFASAQPNL